MGLNPLATRGRRIATGVVALFGEETTGRRLEDISS